MAKKLYVVERNAELYDDDGVIEDFISCEVFYFLDKVQATAKAMSEQEREMGNDGEYVTYKVIEKEFSDVELQ